MDKGMYRSWRYLNCIFIVVDPSKIGVMFSSSMIAYVVLTLLLNGAKMCVTTANTSFMADIIDYELDRTGKYVPAVVAGTYSFWIKSSVLSEH